MNHTEYTYLTIFINRLERASATKSKEIRLTIEEASLLLTDITKILLVNQENNQSQAVTKTELNTNLNIDAGKFK